MRLLMLIIYLVLIVLGVSFAALNATSVPVNFYVTIVNLPVSVLMTLSLGMGILLGFLMMTRRIWRLRRSVKHLRNQLVVSEKEVRNLRTIPLQQ